MNKSQKQAKQIAEKKYIFSKTNKFENFNILIGKNGSGKSYFLDELKNKNIENTYTLSAELFDSSINKFRTFIINLVNGIIDPEYGFSEFKNIGHTYTQYMNDKYALTGKKKLSNSINISKNKGELSVSFSLPLRELFNSFSTGQRRKFTISTLLFFLDNLKEYSSINPDQNKTILVDEIELALNPSLIKEILSSIIKLSKNNGFDVYLSTHSPIVLEQFVLSIYTDISIEKNSEWKYKIFRFSLEDDKRYIKNVLKDDVILIEYIELLSNLKFLTSLFEDRTIIFEGKTDLIYYLALINTYNRHHREEKLLENVFPMIIHGISKIANLQNILAVDSVNKYMLIDDFDLHYVQKEILETINHNSIRILSLEKEVFNTPEFKGKREEFNRKHPKPNKKIKCTYNLSYFFNGGEQEGLAKTKLATDVFKISNDELNKMIVNKSNKPLNNFISIIKDFSKMR